VIDTKNAYLLDGAQILAVARGAGNAGKIDVSLTGDLILENKASISTTASGNFSSKAGAITLNAANVSVLTGSRVESSSSTSGAAGDVTITAPGEVKIDGVSPDGLLTSSIDTLSFGAGPAGAVSIKANKVTLSNFGGIVSAAGAGPAAAGGDISIDADIISLLSGAQVNASTAGQASGGDVTFKNFSTLTISDDQTQVFSGAGQNATGSSGKIIFIGRDATVKDGAIVSTKTSGAGSAGEVSINLSGDLKLSAGALIESRSDETATGDSGDVSVTAKTLTVEDRSRIESSKDGAGVAGDVLIKAETVVIDGSNAPAPNRTGLFADSSEMGAGNAGVVFVDARTMTIQGGGQVSAVARGVGNAGVVKICCLDAFSVIGQNSRIVAGTAVGATGRGGTMFIGSKAITLRDGGQVTVATLGSGLAGQINIIGQTFTANDPTRAGGAGTAAGLATVTGEAAPTGSGAGAIKIEVGSFTLSSGAVVSTSSAGRAPAGTIDIRTGIFNVFGEKTQLISQADNTNGGAAGSVTVGAYDFTFADGATWSTFSRSGGGGNLAIDWNNVGTLTRAQIRTDVQGGGRDAGTMSFGFRVEPINLKTLFDGVFGRSIDPCAGVTCYDPNYTGKKVLVEKDSGIDASNGDTGRGGLIKVADTVTLLSGSPSKFGDVTSDAGEPGVISAPAPTVPPQIVIVPERSVTRRCEAASLGSAMVNGLEGTGFVGLPPGALAPAGLPLAAAPVGVALLHDGGCVSSPAYSMN
jgi:hypothetical protein